MSTPPVDPNVAAGGRAPRDGDTDDRRPPSRSADPGQGSYGGFTGEDTSAQPTPPARDDEELSAALRARLRAFGDDDVESVRIDVDAGRATLSGEVADESVRRRVEARVAEVLGVTGVDNRLRTRDDRASP